MGCKGGVDVGLKHTGECRARIAAKTEQDPAQAKRLEENTTKTLELVRQTWGNVLLEEAATNVPNRARQDAAVAPQESDITCGSSSSTTGDDVELRSTHSGKATAGTRRRRRHGERTGRV